VKPSRVVPLAEYKSLQDSNRRLRHRVVEMHNGGLVRENQAERYRQFLAGTLQVLLWWPFRWLMKATAPWLRTKFQLTPEYPKRAAMFLHVDQQEREREKNAPSTSGSAENGSDEAIEGAEEPSGAAEDVPR